MAHISQLTVQERQDRLAAGIGTQLQAADSNFTDISTLLTGILTQLGDMADILDGLSADPRIEPLKTWIAGQSLALSPVVPQV